MDLRQYKLFLIDLDGTMYRGMEKIEAAPLFIEELRDAGQEFMFLTNNSTRQAEAFAQHMARFGIDVDPEQIYTTSVATAQYIMNEKPGAKVYVIGEEGLKTTLAEAGCQLIPEFQPGTDCDYVVMGLDRQITYEKLAQACLAVRSGATFISTNPDKAFPSERGLLPGNGSLTSVVSVSTQTEPIFIGKPEPLMINLILQEKNLSQAEVLMIGDNYETDILAGINAGIDTAIVFTGYTSKQDLAKVKVKPTYQWDSLLEWKTYLG